MLKLALLRYFRLLLYVDNKNEIPANMKFHNCTPDVGKQLYITDNLNLRYAEQNDCKCLEA